MGRVFFFLLKCIIQCAPFRSQQPREQGMLNVLLRGTSGTSPTVSSRGTASVLHCRKWCRWRRSALPVTAWWTRRAATCSWASRARTPWWASRWRRPPSRGWSWLCSAAWRPAPWATACGCTVWTTRRTPFRYGKVPLRYFLLWSTRVFHGLIYSYRRCGRRSIKCVISPRSETPPASQRLTSLFMLLPAEAHSAKLKHVAK